MSYDNPDMNNSAFASFAGFNIPSFRSFTDMIYTPSPPQEAKPPQQECYTQEMYFPQQELYPLDPLFQPLPHHLQAQEEYRERMRHSLDLLREQCPGQFSFEPTDMELEPPFQGPYYPPQEPPRSWLQTLFTKAAAAVQSDAVDLNIEEAEVQRLMTERAALYQPVPASPRIKEEEDEDSRGRREDSDRLRLVWTQELHDRFEYGVRVLGGSSRATPKNIQFIMNVDGLTTEHIKSHLQKFRKDEMRLRRKEGRSPEEVRVGEEEVSQADLDRLRMPPLKLLRKGSRLKVAPGEESPAPVLAAPAPGTVASPGTSVNDLKEEFMNWLLFGFQLGVSLGAQSPLK